MPCHHHNHNHNHNQCSSCCCCSCCYSTCTSPNPSNHHQQQQQQQEQQQLLEALTALFYQSPVPQIPLIFPSQSLKPQQSLHSQSPVRHQQQHSQGLLQSLLARIAALESSAPHFSPHPFNPCATQSSPPPAPKRPREPKSTVKAPPLCSPEPPPAAAPPPPVRRLSLRDLAARTIQAEFRRFLVRRSRTLRDLKELAVVKSHLAALRPALSFGQDGGHDPRELSQAAMDLLLRLDSIRSGDTMIREGKRSISRELVRILEFIDKVLVKEHRLGVEFDENGKDEGLGRGGDEGSCDVGRVRAKRVSFSESREGLVSSLLDGEGNCSGGDRNGYVDNLEEEFAGVRMRDHPEPEELNHVSEDEKSSEDSLAENGARFVNGGSLEIYSRKRGLSAPQPMQMKPKSWM